MLVELRSGEQLEEVARMAALFTHHLALFKNEELRSGETDDQTERAAYTLGRSRPHIGLQVATRATMINDD